ncbi:cysteine hydrolase family protein [Orrella daihaiensis]|uniref:Cysteine hydrolase n=1 Tax=Orrella daihaiensis TaxID=2782176 RepID=A0ABY4AJF2_9BURK|nr:cysteine hydrolase [Orrella daihaiensis]UOD50421.1 cysteine hydrolase [Orrella daihaiensis]
MIEIHGKQVCQTLPEVLVPHQTAVVAIDIQNDFFSPKGVFAAAGRDMSLANQHLPNMVKLMQTAQANGIFTVFVRQLTLPEGKGDSPAWLRLKVRDGKSPDYTLIGSWGAEFCEGIKPRASDPVVDKFRPDAFHRTNLDLILRSNGIQTVVLLGANTEGCVESTVRSCAHHDYYTVVAEDAVASSNVAYHDASLKLMRNRFLVGSTKEILDCLVG